jgi:hypothetical protein
MVTTAGMTRSSIGAKDPPASSTVAIPAGRTLGSGVCASVAVAVRAGTQRSKRILDGRSRFLMRGLAFASREH